MGAHAEAFEAARGQLMSVAYRMLGSWAEAEDAVQEAWLRFAETDLAEIRAPVAWLTTVVARICLDVLRSARVRREAYVGPWLPEPLVTRLPAQAGGESVPLDPADEATLREEIGLALLVVLERLTPEQRVVFVLHDIFAVPFQAIAPILSTSPEAARQMATRARRAVARGGQPRRRATLAEQHRVVTAFFAAAQSGDIDGLLAVLAPDAVMLGDGGGVAPAGRRPIEGALQAARFLLGLFRRAGAEAILQVEPVLVNGELGLLIEARALDDRQLPAPQSAEPEDVARVVLAFSIDDGRITRVFSQLNPHKLTRVPRLVALREDADR